MMEYILGPPGVCALAFAAGFIAVVRAALKASDSGAQLSKLIARLDREIQEARESIPETEARVARLKGILPGLKKQYGAIDKYMNDLLSLEAGLRAAEKEEDERRKALGTHKVDMGRD